MLLPPGFLDELRTRLSLSRVVGRKGHMGCAQIQSGQGRYVGSVSVPSRKDGVVPRG